MDFVRSSHPSVLIKTMAAPLNPTSIGAFIQHESSPESSSQRAGKANRHDKTSPPTNIELDAIQWGQPLPGPSESGAAGPSIPPTPGELERSQPPTPKREHAVDALAALSPRTPRNRWRLAAAGLVFMMVGMVDAVVSSSTPAACYHGTDCICRLVRFCPRSRPSTM